MIYFNEGLVSSEAVRLQCLKIVGQADNDISPVAVGQDPRAQNFMVLSPGVP